MTRNIRTITLQLQHRPAQATKEQARVQARETRNAQQRAVPAWRELSLQATLTRVDREREAFARRGPAAPFDLSGRRPARSSGARRNCPVDEAELPASCSGVPAAIT